MADVILALGGPYRFSRCGMGNNGVYDNVADGGASRIAGEYMHGLFTVGNSFNPLFSEGQAEALAKYNVGVGDFVGLFEVPMFHTLLDVATRVKPKQNERGYDLGMNSDGLVFDVEVRKYSRTTGEQTGTVDLMTPITGIAANTFGIKRSAVKPDEGGYFVEDGEYLIMGLKVVALPTGDAVGLADVTSRVELTGHVYDYEAPIHV